MQTATEGKGVSPKASLDEVMEVMTEQMRLVRSNPRTNLDVAKTQNGICNTLLKGYAVELHYRSFEHELEREREPKQLT